MWLPWGSELAKRLRVGRRDERGKRCKAAGLAWREWKGSSAVQPWGQGAAVARGGQEPGCLAPFAIGADRPGRRGQQVARPRQGGPQPLRQVRWGWHGTHMSAQLIVPTAYTSVASLLTRACPVPFWWNDSAVTRVFTVQLLHYCPHLHRSCVALVGGARHLVSLAPASCSGGGRRTQHCRPGL